METQTETTAARRANGGTTTRGRKDSEGQEVVIKLEPLKKSIDELVRLYTKKTAAAEALSNGVTTVAEKSGLLAAVVRKFVKARADGDNYEEAKRSAEQLSLVFEELGEG